MQEFKGSGATLQVYENKIVIKRHGLNSFLIHGSKGDKEIFIKNITAIQMKKPGFTSGFIQFSLSGEKASKGGAFDAAKDENSIMLTSEHYNNFLRAKELIESYIKQRDNPTSSSNSHAISVADELRKLADLKSEGFLTDAEFQEQKKKLLG
ncbi:SHOCT domain-containing protein [Dyadobacter fermentans]|uniref:SHOCT domain-containing protein n=1 Tax=Dyadobacter fermentans TaxID=94254 RepID=UPI001CBC301E|nr:SHOCT domain-containing protein [Dyadobacter fermentans]MBZ1362173.1 SHOCT domain-containing protein [Dyadobacter fermentans]